MSTRNRQSTARSVAGRSSVAPASSRAAAPSDQLPPYKKPSHPLDADAARALRALQGRNLDEVKKHTKQATEMIITTVGSVNDMLREHEDYLGRREKRWAAGKGLETKEQEERAMKKLQERVDEATSRLEESMRAVIDSGVATQRLDGTLDWLRQNAPRQLEEEYQTQMSQRATQRQSQTHTGIQRRRANDDGDDEEDSEEDNQPTPGPTPLDGSRVALTGASEIFTTRMQQEKDTYTKLSLTARYARNNDYRDFKRIVHDAKYGDTGPVLGHEDTWFTETGSPAPGITDVSQRGGFDDDDIVMDRETISTKCPITFQQLKEPYTSTKCPHTFEKNAILEMIRNSRAPNGKKEYECPINGCSQILSANDFRSDPIIIRKIKRIQQAEREAAQEDSDDDAEREAAEEHSDDGAQLKDTKPSKPGPPARSTQRPPQSSIVEGPGRSE